MECQKHAATDAGGCLGRVAGAGALMPTVDTMREQRKGDRGGGRRRIRCILSFIHISLSHGTQYALALANLRTVVNELVVSDDDAVWTARVKDLLALKIAWGEDWKWKAYLTGVLLEVRCFWCQVVVVVAVAVCRRVSL